MNWELDYLPEAKKDLSDFSVYEQKLIVKAISKVLQNPLPASDGGYGKPLGNKNGTSLAGFSKIKLRAMGIRVVYKLVMKEGKMLVIIIGARADDEVYDIAQNRIRKHNL